MRWTFHLFLIVILTLLTVSSSAFCTEQTPTIATLRIAVASNFSPVLKKLLVEFQQTNHIKTELISAATGALSTQIQHGAPYDIFIAADSVRPEKLEQLGLVVNNSRKTYAYGQLAFFSNNSAITLAELTTILQHESQRIAIANPDLAPYGKAAKETLMHLGLWQSYQIKLIQGININQTFLQIRSQAVSRGFIANSQLVLNHLTGTIIPDNYHQPIAQQLVILKTSQHIPEAQKFSEYLLSPQVQQQIINFGYSSKIIERNHD